jgi:hypothetical protein
LEFTNAAADGLWIAVEKSRQVLEATPLQFENLGGSIKTAFPFTQGVKKLPHRGFGRGGIGIDHASVLPKVRRSHSADCLSCQMNAVPESAKREVNKLRVLAPELVHLPDKPRHRSKGLSLQAFLASELVHQPDKPAGVHCSVAL